MTLGFDVDGVLVNFIPAYQRLFCELSGRNLFEPNDDKSPICWNWPEYRGYTRDEVNAVWTHIKQSHDFWLSLAEAPGCATLRMCVLDLQRFHDLYFVTSRIGVDVKWQSEQWLKLHLGIEAPTVLISSQKGLCAKALKLDCYLDDNADNVNDVVLKTIPEVGSTLSSQALYAKPETRTYLLDCSYNRPGGPEDVNVDVRVTRVKTVGEFLDRELHNL